ncbi:MAG: polyheme membrane-associated cytochrome C [Chloroflexota bacterium]
MRNLLKSLKKRQRLLWTVAAFVIPAVVIVQAVLRIESGVSVETATVRWDASGHADYTSESFTHWDDDEPPLIPADCASCHSQHGFLDFLGERGTSAGSVSQDMPIGTVISCNVCHNETAHNLESMTFSSGATVRSLNAGEATCLHCHQSRESTISVNEAISGFEDDTVSEDLEFINAHYLVSASTMLGTEAQGAYEYANTVYADRYVHHTEFQTCQSCHDPHDGRIEPLECSACHVNVSEFDDLTAIRNTMTDFDGDGDTSTGIAVEIDNLHRRLHDAIVRYADEVIGQPIVYSPDHFPYFFNDVSENGEVDPETLNFGNRYTTWTPRLVRTAYNYHYVQNDPGAYAHNPHYAVQLLYDSLADLSESTTVNMDGLIRADENGDDD